MQKPIRKAVLKAIAFAVALAVALVINSHSCCSFADTISDDESFLLKLPAPHSKEANEQEANEQEARQKAKEEAADEAKEKATEASEVSKEKANAKVYAEDLAKETPKGLGLEEARQYLVSLINRDRAFHKLKPVVLDEVASNAGQSHTDEMATNGYLAHWGMDGKKPDQRYTEGGGRDAVSENATADNDAVAMPLLPHGTFQKSDMEEIENGFYNEKPPMDGHRKNILRPEHNRVGIALSLAGTAEENRYACTQEFVDHYGEFAEIPKTLKLGQTFKLEGKLDKGVHFYSVELDREDLPKPMSIAALNKTYSYSFPEESVANYWPGNYKTDAPVTLEKKDGSEVFWVDIHLPTSFKKGLYYVLVWASTDEQKEDFPVSVRTIVVE